MNEIMTIEGTVFNVDCIKTLDDIKTFMLKLDTLKKLLESTNKWHENICKYCGLEATAYYKIAKLNMQEIGIRHNSIKYKTIKWLEGLSEKEAEDLIARSFNDGISITAIYQEQVINPRKQERALLSLKESSNEIIKEIESNGYVNLCDYDKFYFDDAKEILGNDIVNSHIDGIRSKLRQRGAYGIGNGEGTYVDKNYAKEYINEIIKTRLDSIAKDVNKLRDLKEQMQEESLPLATGTIERQSRGLSLTELSAINIFLALLHIIKPNFREDTADYKIQTIRTILLELGIYEDAKALYK